MIHRAREGFLKFALLVAFWGGAAPAAADELLTGALRDQDGAALAGARVSALDARGTVIGRDRSAGDGTFALTAAARPAALLVSADDSDPLRIVVPPDGPVTAVVRRHHSADRVPSVSDVAALPAGSLAEIATVIPYWIAFPNVLGNRWLDRGRGVTTIEGLPFYRRADGADAGSLLPTHAIGAVAVHDPLEAPFYGDRAGGGIIDGRLFDRLDAARVTNRDASLLVGGDTALLAATSWDPDGERRVVAARTSRAFGSVTANLVALTGDLPGTHYAGLGAGVRGASSAIDLSGAFDFTRQVVDADGVPDAGSVVSLSADASARGPNALAVRARWRDERGVLGNLAVEHQDAAFVVGTVRGAPNATRVAATVALAYGLDRGSGAVPQSALAVLPSLSINTPLSANWSLHLGAGDSTLGTPGIAIAHAALGEAGLSFNDRHRVHVDFLAYVEGDAAPRAVTRGFAANLGWEIAPRLSLRAWSLRDSDVQEVLVAEYPGGPVETIGIERPFRRDLLWLTWDGPARFDLLVRAGALEGDVRVPLGRRYVFTAGSARRLIGGKRSLDIGITAR
jgi:hypothetical protein